MPAPTPLAPLAVQRVPALDDAAAKGATPSTAPASAAAPLPPVFLLHGFASTATEDFSGWLPELAAAGREVHLVDLPGHGASPAIPDPASATTSAVVRALADAIDGTGADRVDVIAYSLGARLAWELPRATGRVRRLVLGGLSPFEPFAVVDTTAITRVIAGAAPADPLTGMMAAMVCAPGRDTDSLLALMTGLGSEPFDPAAPGASRPDVPTLFAAGADDLMAAGVDALVASVAGSRFVVVPGDHRGALDSGEFRRAAIDFLR